MNFSSGFILVLIIGSMISHSHAFSYTFPSCYTFDCPTDASACIAADYATTAKVVGNIASCALTYCKLVIDTDATTPTATSSCSATCTAGTTGTVTTTCELASSANGNQMSSLLLVSMLFSFFFAKSMAK